MQADNVFGMTYAEARRMAGESLNKIDLEKSDSFDYSSGSSGDEKYGSKAELNTKDLNYGMGL